MSPAGGWLRLDPRTLVTQPVRTAAKALVPTLAGLVGIGSTIGFGLALPIAAAVVVVAGAVPWLTTTYRVTASHLEVRSGLLNRTTVTARLDRVRSVDLESDVVHRVLGVTKVAVGTGVDDSRITLDSLGTAEAERLRVALLHGAPETVAAPDGTAGPVTDAAGHPRPPAASPAVEIARLDWSWVRFAPLNVANLAVALAGVGALASQFDQLVDERRAEGLWHWLSRTDVPLVVGLVVLGGAVLWVPLSCLGYAVRWAGLLVTRERGKDGPTLRRVHGALTQRATTVEEAKVRGVVVRRRVLVGLAGGAELAVLTTGLEDNETHLLPACPDPVVREVATDVLGEADAVAVPVVAHGPRARARYRFRNVRDAVLLVVGTAAVGWGVERAAEVDLPAWPLIPELLVAVAVALAAAELRYRRLGHALTDRYLVSCTGTYDAVRTALETDGIVGWRLHQSFFDRRRGLAQLTATTAAGAEHVDVPDVPLGEAVALAAAATPRTLADFLEGGREMPSRPATVTGRVAP